jgi:hypothetical protein
LCPYVYPPTPAFNPSFQSHTPIPSPTHIVFLPSHLPLVHAPMVRPLPQQSKAALVDQCCRTPPPPQQHKTASVDRSLRTGCRPASPRWNYWA